MSLAISRRKNEGFLIGENIYISIVSIGREQVKLSIDAPLNYKIVRDELVVNPDEFISSLIAKKKGK